MMAGTLLVDAPGDAADEPNRLKALEGLTNPDQTAAVSASQTLEFIFPGVLTNLTTITENAADINAINNAVTLINCLR